ncbi:uncharacterized protein At4g14342-like [Zingiber officinale]|uniref:uncharacterized protein At4g14342-like n=1 Tax=Zingiber officinale TaxID=94328 RepID=UPI001C4DAFA4|nr:uncharacterized protein At4g14342-like [Zingiber officinale]
MALIEARHDSMRLQPTLSNSWLVVMYAGRRSVVASIGGEDQRRVGKEGKGESAVASDRFNINSQLEHLQTKYVGTGHADLNRFEWGVNIQRDSYASYIGHYPILAYFSVAKNESIGRQRYNFMQKMLLPCGLPPEREED